MGERGQVLFSNSPEKPIGQQPGKPSWKKRSAGPKKINIKREQIKSLEVDSVDIDRYGGKQPLSGDPEIDQIDIDRHKAEKTKR